MAKLSEPPQKFVWELSKKGNVRSIMKNTPKLIVSWVAFIVVGVASHFPLAVISLHLITRRRIAFPALIIGLGILIYGSVQAIGAIRKRHVWVAAAWGIVVSFAVALSVVANQIILSIR